jgi:hypothetical protein
MHCKDDKLVITTAEAALSSLQSQVKNAMNGKKISMSDQVIKARRAEAENE